MRIAVVGLGIAGLSVCARLALAGHDVSGFDQFEPMHANGSSHGDTRIMRLTPGEGEIYVKLARRAHEIWRTWEGLAGRPFIEWTGGLMAGPRGSPFVAASQRLSHTPAAIMRGDAVHAMTRGYIAMPYEWDVFRQADAGVIAADAVRAFLLKQAPRWGAKLHHSARIEAPIDGLVLKINDEARAFDVVIVAAGGWARKLLPEFAGKLAVKRRVVGWFESPNPRMAPVICADNDEGVYGMPAPRGFISLACTPSAAQPILTTCANRMPRMQHCSANMRVCCCQRTNPNLCAWRVASTRSRPTNISSSRRAASTIAFCCSQPAPVTASNSRRCLAPSPKIG
ncbi:MAG: FAD-dependent oxidoreductase [Hyphomonadaceae bacterium JAD_PAG50586_4]|nr:MAG: FAD-dependent oxidoreductase [Hyphomonadaceae bacterium JAD_PAG50586_4]